ncbi:MULTISPECIES: hypothetical protein [unclassified Microcoleus]|uniref:hypothetical protein n=1 Tax=unclassified Microcoleus TaxID=2642155 RepID=UPI0025ED5683|nr:MULTISPECIES: hypothetical protein [unclassified Microcoleus]
MRFSDNWSNFGSKAKVSRESNTKIHALVYIFLYTALFIYVQLLSKYSVASIAQWLTTESDPLVRDRISDLLR